MAQEYPVHDERGQQCTVRVGDGFCPRFQISGSHFCPEEHAPELEAMLEAEAEAMRCPSCGRIHDDAPPSPQDVEAARLECLAAS